MGRGAWWAAVYGVAQSRTRLKRLSITLQKKKKRERERETLFFKANFIYIYIFYNSCDFVFFFFPLILYFWKSNLYSRFLIFVFGICYQFCTFKNPIFSTHFYLGARLLAWLLSPALDSSFSPPGASISSLPLLFSTQLCESLCVFRTVENT